MCVWDKDTEFVVGKEVILLRLKIWEEVEGGRDD